MENFDAKKIARKLRWGTAAAQIAVGLCCIAIMVSTFFAKEVAPGRVIVALLLYYLLNTVIVLRANKRLHSALYQDLMPQRLLDILREGKIFSRNGTVELHAKTAAGDWQGVADICAQKLRDPAYRTKKHVYMAFLADLYFNLADEEQLRTICDAFDAYAAVSKADIIMRNMREPMACYRDYLNGEYERCYAFCEKKKQLMEKTRPHPYIAMIHDFEHAVICYRTGRTDQARALFAHVAADGPQLALATLSQAYLAAIESGEPLAVPFARIVPSGEKVLRSEPRWLRVLRRVKKICLIVAISVWVVAIILLLIAEILS